MGYAYYVLKKYDKARNHLNKALSINNEYLQAKLSLIGIDLLTGKSKAALTRARRIQKEHPDDITGYLVEGDIHRNLKNYVQAKRAYRHALKVKVNPAAIEKLSNVYMLAGEPDKAVETLQDGIKKLPDAVALQLHLASIYQMNRKETQARAVYEKLLHSHPKNVVMLNNYANLLMDVDIKRARELAEQAHQINSANAGIADTLGWIYVQMGEDKQAMPLLQKAAAASKNATIQYHYAEVLARTGKRQEALNVVNAILSGKGKFAERDAARKLQHDLSQ